MKAIPYLILAVIIVLFLMRLGVNWRMRRMVGREVAEATSGRRLYYFYSPTCSACRSMMPIIDRLAGEHDVVKVDASIDLETARRFNVMGTPTTVAVEDGRVKRAVVGARTEQALREMLGA